MNSQQESEIHSRLTYIGRNLDEIWKALDRIEKMLRMRKCDDSKSV